MKMQIKASERVVLPGHGHTCMSENGPAPSERARGQRRELFLQQPATERCRLLQVVVEKPAWQDGALRTTWFQPFGVTRHSNREGFRKEKENAGSGRDLGISLSSLDAFRTFAALDSSVFELMKPVLAERHAVGSKAIRPGRPNQPHFDTGSGISRRLCTPEERPCL